MPALAPDLTVCRTAAGSSSNACAASNVTLTAGSPVVIFSLGKDWAAFTSADEVENVGANLGGGPSSTTYRVASDVVFVSRGRSELPGSEFDDQLRWLAPNRLYGRLVDAGHLP